MKKRIKKSILSSFVCDSYSLGAHWVYDEKELANLNIDWESLNTPQSLWHKGKESGDLTHYGDHTLFLLEFLSQNKSFDKQKYYNFWKEKMSNYEGYVDGSSREALEGIGASSSDLSICGRIAPLLQFSSSKEDFLNNVAEFVSITHNSELALNATAFFAELLYSVKENRDITSLIYTLRPKYPMLEKWIAEAIAKQDENSFETIRDFGPACAIDGGFSGVIYLLIQNKTFKELMIENAKAGGDSSARGMVVAMILGISKDIELPKEWLSNMNKLAHIESL